MDRKIIAIIPARGGSKGLPRKNVLDLNGKPLIAHTIDAAINCKIFDKIIVTTDDLEIKKISLEFGAEVIDRPKYLATDTASSLDAIGHVLNEIKNEIELFTHFILLQPTSPLRTEIHIQEAWRKYINDTASSLVSVCEVEHSPFKILIENEDGEIKPLTKWEDLTMPRQKLPKAYLPNGAIYINNINRFRLNKNLFESKLSLYNMNNNISIDVDTMNDIKIIKRILDDE